MYLFIGYLSIHYQLSLSLESNSKMDQIKNYLIFNDFIIFGSSSYLCLPFYYTVIDRYKKWSNILEKTIDHKVLYRFCLKKIILQIFIK